MSNDTKDGRATSSSEVICWVSASKTWTATTSWAAWGLRAQVCRAVTAVAERIQYSEPTPQTFDPNDRMRKLGPATRCGERAGGYLLIDSYALEPAELRRGEQAILTIDMHVCVPQGNATR